MLEKFWPLIVLIIVGVVTLALLVPTGAEKAGDKLAPLTELEIEDPKVGEGEEVKRGDKVAVHYTGTLRATGKKFDSSHDRGEPFELILGAGQVIQGWDDGIPGMRVGGVRILKIPAKMAYGDRAKGRDIPANSDLIFKVELIRKL